MLDKYYNFSMPATLAGMRPQLLEVIAEPLALV